MRTLYIQKAMDDRKVKIKEYDSKSGKLLSQTRGWRGNMNTLY